jgi:uncharacterized damage-inducible protein DinB
MENKEFITLIDHQAWADRRVADAIAVLPQMHDKSKKLFDHILAAQHTWISRILNVPSEISVWPLLSNSQWPILIEKHHQQLLDLVNTNRLQNELIYKNSTGQEFSNTVAEVLLHLTLHSQYHRGQVISYSLEYFEKPPVIDMIAYLRIK